MSVSISIVIPTFNRSEFLALAIDSLVCQSTEDWEALVLDDGSDPCHYAEITKQCARDCRIKLQQRRSKVRGANVCRNEGLALASGEYVIFLDSDDSLGTPDALRERIQFLNSHKELDFCVSPTVVFKHKPGDMDLLHNIPTAEEDLVRFLKRDIPWQTTGPTWRRLFLKRIGNWREGLSSWQDWDFHIRALLANPNYTKIDIGESYWRMGGAHMSVGANARSATYLCHILPLLLDMGKGLKEMNLLTAGRAEALAFSFFFVSLDLKRCGMHREADHCWKAYSQFAPTQTYNREVGLYLRLFRIPLLAGAMRILMRRHSPDSAIPCFSSTLRRCPVALMTRWGKSSGN